MRLIDADELMEHAWRDKLDSRELIAEMIEKAPTIKEIPTRIPIDVFEKLISQQPRWIPVSERLPKDGQYVLFCDIDNDIMVGYHVKGRPDTHFTQDGTFEDMKNVRAWQPLPEPYNAESEG